MSTTLPLPNKIQKNPEEEGTFNTLEIQFGNGYRQAAPNGLNSQKSSFVISWVGLTEAEKNTVMSAVRFAGGHGVFTWTPPGETTARKFINKDKGYKIRQPKNGVFVVSITLEETFVVE